MAATPQRHRRQSHRVPDAARLIAAPPGSRGIARSLDAINFLLSDVRGALGPYLNVFLVTQRHWSQSEVGLVTTVSGLLGLAVQSPIGAAIDETRAKRGVIVLALAVLAVSAIWDETQVCNIVPLSVGTGVTGVNGSLNQGSIGELGIWQHQPDRRHVGEGWRTHPDAAGNIGTVRGDRVKHSPRGPSTRLIPVPSGTSTNCCLRHGPPGSRAIASRRMRQLSIISRARTTSRARTSPEVSTGTLNCNWA